MIQAPGRGGVFGLWNLKEFLAHGWFIAVEAKLD